MMTYNVKTGIPNDSKYNAPYGTIGVIETNKRTKFYVLDVDNKIIADANGKPKMWKTKAEVFKYAKVHRINVHTVQEERFMQSTWSSEDRIKYWSD